MIEKFYLLKFKIIINLYNILHIIIYFGKKRIK